jgi:uncharacterized protein YecT (DUF1311 family)
LEAEANARRSTVVKKGSSLAILVAVISIFCLGIGQAGAIGATTGPRPTPPAIHEPFASAPLPCTGTPDKRTTVQMEGCVEQEILETDAKIERLDDSIVSLLGRAGPQRKFIAGVRAWLAYRRADCKSISSLYEGGSLAPVTEGECVIARNEQRIKDLRGFQKVLSV